MSSARRRFCNGLPAMSRPPAFEVCLNYTPIAPLLRSCCMGLPPSRMTGAGWYPSPSMRPMRPEIHPDLAEIARQAMRDHGLEPDFPPAALAEAERLAPALPA